MASVSWKKLASWVHTLQDQTFVLFVKIQYNINLQKQVIICITFVLWNISSAYIEPNLQNFCLKENGTQLGLGISITPTN